MSNAFKPTAPLIGVRSWKVSDDGNALRGVSANKNWKPGDDEAHEISATLHSGFHAYSPQHADKIGGWGGKHWDTDEPYVEIVGVVIGWGRCFIHDTGWRSQFARPVALVSWQAHVEKWADTYGIKDNPKVTDPANLLPEKNFQQIAQRYGVYTAMSSPGAAVQWVAGEGLGAALSANAHLFAAREGMLSRAMGHERKAAEEQRKANEVREQAEAIMRDLRIARERDLRIAAVLEGAAS